MELFLNRIESPLGEMLLVTDSHGVVRALDFANHEVRLHRELRERFSDLEPAPRKGAILYPDRGTSQKADFLPAT
jgi:methylated-DNA-[protein]-cysteine S-methyltransferase